MNVVSLNALDDLPAICANHRAYARTHPFDATKAIATARDPRTLIPYTFQYAKYRVSISYVTYAHRAPDWHAQVAILEDLNELQFGAVEQGLLAVQSWTNEDISAAREILGECLGPEIIRRTQPITEHRGLMMLHWTLSAERPPDGPSTDTLH